MEFLERFDNFKGSEIHSLNIISPQEIELTLTAQDKARSYDWVSVTFSFSGVTDARLLDEKKIGFVDFDDGITLLNENNTIGFGVGKYHNILGIKNASLYIIADRFKYNEGSF